MSEEVMGLLMWMPKQWNGDDDDLLMEKILVKNFFPFTSVIWSQLGSTLFPVAGTSCWHVGLKTWLKIIFHSSWVMKVPLSWFYFLLKRTLLTIYFPWECGGVDWKLRVWVCLLGIEFWDIDITVKLHRNLLCSATARHALHATRFNFNSNTSKSLKVFSNSWVDSAHKDGWFKFPEWKYYKIPDSIKRMFSPTVFSLFILISNQTQRKFILFDKLLSNNLKLSWE